MSGEAVVRREVTLSLEQFGRKELKSQAETLHVPVSALVRQAVLYYLALLGSERTGGQIPRFRRDRKPVGETFELALELEEAEWSALEVEAVRERLPIERLIEHAAMVFLVDIDSGRVAVRIVEGEEPEER